MTPPRTEPRPAAPFEEEIVESREIALRGDHTLSVTPQVPAAELVARLAVIQEAMQTAMVPNVDYGVIPGTDKPALLKPGAEKLGALFQLDVQLENEKIWHDDGHLTVIARAVVWHQPTGARLGAGEGICTTRESRYAYRNASRVCPACKVEAIIKGKEEYGGGWVCFKKKGGCGAKYADDAAEITSQTVGKIPNPDIADTWNTVDKMASKRARVDAVLSVTGASALFTQDVEDIAPVAAATVKQEMRPAVPRGEKMRLRIQELAQQADKDQERNPGTTWAAVCDAIALHTGNAQDWETIGEVELEWLGVELSNWAAAGYTMTFKDWAEIPF